MYCLIGGGDRACGERRLEAIGEDLLRQERVFLSFQMSWMRYQRNPQFQNRNGYGFQNYEMQEQLQSRRQPLPLCLNVGVCDELE